MYILNIYNGFLEFSFNVENWYSPTESGDYHIDTYEIIPNTLYNITAVFKNAGTDIYINGVLFASIPETITANTNKADNSFFIKSSFILYYTIPPWGITILQLFFEFVNIFFI